MAFVTDADYTPPDGNDGTDGGSDGADGGSDGVDDGDDGEPDGDDGEPDDNTDGSDGGSSDSQQPQDGHMGFNWGNLCSGNVELCSVDPNCSDCRWSWPADDPMLWNSYDAHCRCSTWDGEYAEKPEDGHKGLGWGSTCSNFDSESCALTPNCDNCRWSWPIDDPLLWSSNDAECRCASEIEIEYGNDCGSMTD